MGPARSPEGRYDETARGRQPLMRYEAPETLGAAIALLAEATGDARVPALIAAGAVATLAGPQGRRDLPVEDVMLGPRQLALGKGEIVVSFWLPPRPPRSSDAYLRFIPRTEMDIAVVGAGVSLTVDNAGTISAARVSLGAVAPRVLLVREAAAAIVGSRLDRPAQDRLEAAARAACVPIDDKRGTIEFRIQVAGVLARRAALIALDRARTN